MDRRLNYLMAQTKYYRTEKFFPLEGNELFSQWATSLEKTITQHPQPQYLIMSPDPKILQPQWSTATVA